MRKDLLTRVLFIIYCVEAGALLLVTPWGGGWERLVFQIPSPALRSLCLHPIPRSAVSGFGLLHLIWGVHDLDLLLARWRRRGRRAS